MAKAYLCRILVENIYSRKVFEDYQRRWKEVVGRPWHQGMMSEYFLWRVDSSHKQRSASQAVLSAKLHAPVSCLTLMWSVHLSWPACSSFWQRPFSHAASGPSVLHTHF